MTAMTRLAIGTMALAATALQASTFGASAPEPAAVAAELAQYLDVHGDVCLGKFDWPVEVTERDVRFDMRDALQMPVLERLGLVTSTLVTTVRKIDDVEQTVAVKRYSLTPAGRASYLERPVSEPAPGSAEPATRRADLCAGKMSLDKVVDWSLAGAEADAVQVSVSYTYRFTPAPWVQDPQAQRVFPMVARVMQGQGTMQMRQDFRIADGHWTPVSPGN